MNTQATISFRHFRSVGTECTHTDVTVRLAGSARGLDARQREASVRICAALSTLPGVEVPGAVVIEDPQNAWDLPAALAVLAHQGAIDARALESTLCIGDLGLSGKVHRARYEAALVTAALQPDSGFERVLVAHGAQHRADDTRVRSVDSLREAVQFASGKFAFVDLPLTPAARRFAPKFAMADVRGYDRVKSELREALARGARRVLLVSDVGCGRTMLARRLAEYLPSAQPSAEDERKLDAVYSAAGLDLLGYAPFRAPHHTVSEAGLLGSKARPGELALAHTGTLFLDEVLELGRGKLEVMLRAIGDGHHHGWPCQPALLVAAANPCPCGYSARSRCRCTHAARVAWEARLTALAASFDVVVRVKSPTSAHAVQP